MGSQLSVDPERSSLLLKALNIEGIVEDLDEQLHIRDATEWECISDCPPNATPFVHESVSLAPMYLTSALQLNQFMQLQKTNSANFNGSELSDKSSVASMSMDIDNMKDLKQVRARLRRLTYQKEEHPICKSLPRCPCVEFISSEVLETLTPPWPRNQELAADHKGCIYARPDKSDVIVAISHMWYFEKHPDPFGEKANACRDLIKQTESFKSSAGRTLLFFDFLSLTQPPFHSTQQPRSAKQNQQFQLALKALPMIYLYSDIILLLDSAAVQGHTSTEFGRASTTPASERGWIYLERFIAMIKVAMTPENTDTSVQAAVVLSNSPTLLKEIVDAGQRLREAAKAGKRALKEALQGHLVELQSKTFSAISTDKQTNQGGVAGGPTYSVQMSDREVVFATMTLMVEKLFQYWGSFADGEVFSYKTLVWEKARLAVMCRRFKVRKREEPQDQERPPLESVGYDMSVQNSAVDQPRLSQPVLSFLN